MTYVCGTHHISSWMFFCWESFIVISLVLDGRTGLTSSKWWTFWLHCFQSSANQRLSFIFHLQTYFFFREILYVEKPPETAWNRLKELLSGSKRFKVVESDLKCFKALPANAYFSILLWTTILLPFKFPHLFISNFFFVKFSMSRKCLKPLETDWKRFTKSAWNWLKAL